MLRNAQLIVVQEQMPLVRPLDGVSQFRLKLTLFGAHGTI